MEYVLLALIILPVIIVIFIYNRLVALRQTRQQAFADIDVQLKQRFDIVPNLIETVKGYASHEKEVLQGVTDARTSVQNAKQGTGNAEGLGERVAAENMLSRAMMNLFAVAENYPDLKADQNYRRLMDELSDIENKIAAARRFFNNATSELNTAIEQFPAVLFAGKFGFTKEEFFEIEDADRAKLETPPEVKF